MSKLAAKIFESIEMDNLVDVKGKPGLFHFDKVINGKLIRVYSMHEDKFMNVPIQNVAFLKDFSIFTTSGDPTTPLKIFDTLSNIEEADNQRLARVGKEDITDAFMKRVLENHSDAFKNYHLAKIIGWYIDLKEFLTKVEEYEKEDRN
jgi:hypothetical protein